LNKDGSSNHVTYILSLVSLYAGYFEFEELLLNDL